MTLKKTVDLKTLILNLLTQRKEISFQDIVEAAGLSVTSSTHRRAVQLQKGMRVLECMFVVI